MPVTLHVCTRDPTHTHVHMYIVHTQTHTGERAHPLARLSYPDRPRSLAPLCSYCPPFLCARRLLPTTTTTTITTAITTTIIIVAGERGAGMQLRGLLWPSE